MIFPDRVEMGFWRIWLNYLVIAVLFFVVGGVVATVVHVRTDWLDQLRRIINGG